MKAIALLIAVSASALAGGCSSRVAEPAPVATQRTFYSDGACDRYDGDTCDHYIVYDAIRL